MYIIPLAFHIARSKPQTDSSRPRTFPTAPIPLNIFATSPSTRHTLQLAPPIDTRQPPRVLLRAARRWTVNVEVPRGFCFAAAVMAEPVSSFEAFADAYRAAKSLDLAEQLDPESGTALVFADICAERARLDEDGVVAPLEDVNVDEWKTEEHTWTLIQLLFSYVPYLMQ